MNKLVFLSVRDTSEDVWSTHRDEIQLDSSSILYICDRKFDPLEGVLVVIAIYTYLSNPRYDLL